MFERNHVPKNDCCMYDNFSIVQLVCWLFTNIGNIFVVKLCTGEKANVCSVNVCIGNGQSWPTLMTKIYIRKGILFSIFTFMMWHSIPGTMQFWLEEHIEHQTFQLLCSKTILSYLCLIAIKYFVKFIDWTNFVQVCYFFPFVRMLWIGAWFL